MKFLITTLFWLYSANALYIPSFAKRHMEDDTIPLITPSGEPFRGPQGRCLQNMTINPIMEDVEFPAWIGHQYDDIFFYIDCQGLKEAVAIASKDTKPLQLAKYFALTYLSTVHVMDWRQAELSAERMELVDQFWETGRFYKDAESVLIV